MAGKNQRKREKQKAYVREAGNRGRLFAEMQSLPALPVLKEHPEEALFDPYPIIDSGDFID